MGCDGHFCGCVFVFKHDRKTKKNHSKERRSEMMTNVDDQDGDSCGSPVICCEQHKC